VTGDGENVTYKLIAIDLDGTLLNPQGEVSPRTRRAVHAALAAELLVCFATGRNYTESQVILDAVAHYDSAVFVGGAMVIDTRHRMTLHRTLMAPDLARQLCGFFESNQEAVLALQDTGTAGVDYLMSKSITPSAATRQWLGVTNATVHAIDELENHPHEHTVRIGIVVGNEKAKFLSEQLRKQYASRIVSHCIFVPAYNVQVLEVFDPAVNKWEGILHVARRHKIAPGEIIAIGDDVNDIPMVKNAGLGVAMGNAHPELRAVAKRIIGSNHDDGLALFLEELVEQHNVEPLSERA
jgi:Cof subfamily protein (haloacid dehalogenase superfamily)